MHGLDPTVTLQLSYSVGSNNVLLFLKVVSFLQHKSPVTLGFKRNLFCTVFHSCQALGLAELLPHSLLGAFHGRSHLFGMLGQVLPCLQSCWRPLHVGIRGERSLKPLWP